MAIPAARSRRSVLRSGAAQTQRGLAVEGSPGAPACRRRLAAPLHVGVAPPAARRRRAAQRQAWRRIRAKNATAIVGLLGSRTLSVSRGPEAGPPEFRDGGAMIR